MALSATFISVVYYFRGVILSDEYRAYLNISTSEVKRDFIKGLAFLPDISLPVLFWFVVGVIAYFMFYSLQSVYSDISEYLYHKLFYIHQKSNPEEEFIYYLSRLKRIIIHLIIVLSYVCIITFGVLLIPLFEHLRNLSQVVIARFVSNQESSIFYSFGVNLILWFLVLSFLVFVYKYIFQFQRSAEIEEKHY